MKKGIIVVMFLILFLTGCTDLEESVLYEIEFMINESVHDVEELYEGELIELPIDPVKANHTFIGWFLDETCIHSFGFGAMPESDITVYGCFTEDTIIEQVPITISFESNGGSAISNVVINQNEMYTPAMIPTKVGYEFKGWYMDSELLYPVPFMYRFLEDVTLYAKWEMKTVTISFFADDELLDRVELSYGEPIYDIYIPEIPSKTGYDIVGWDKILPDEVTTDIEFHAEYTILSFTLYHYVQMELNFEFVVPGREQFVGITTEGVIWLWGEGLAVELLNEEFDLTEGEYIIKTDSAGELKAFMSNLGKIYIMQETTMAFASHSITEYDRVIEVTSDYDSVLELEEAIVDIKVSGSNLYVLTDLGNIYVHGNNIYDEAGTGDAFYVPNPLLVNDMITMETDEVFVGVEASDASVIIWTNHNRVFVTGWNDNYQIGLPLTTPYQTWEEVLDLDTDSVLLVETTYASSIIVTNSGLIYGTGQNAFNMLDDSVNEEYQGYTNITSHYSTLATNILDIQGKMDTFFITATDGTIYSSGSNVSGSQGLGDSDQDNHFLEMAFPTLVLWDDEVVEQVIVSDDGGYIITNKDRLFGFGRNDKDQLIYSNIEEQPTPYNLMKAFPNSYTILLEEVYEYNSEYINPTPPELEGHTFIGWYEYLQIGSEGIELYTPEFMPANHLMLYTYYEEDTVE